VLRGGGGGGGASGTGTFKGTVPANGVFVHHVNVPADSVLLVKAIPEGNFDSVVSIAGDFPTIEKYKNNFGATDFGRGALQLASDNPTFGSVDLTSLANEGMFLSVNSGFGPGTADPLILPVPEAASFDIVVSALDGGSGQVTLQVETRQFVGPSTRDDQGFFYVQLLNRAYADFLNGAAEIADASNFTKESDFTDNSDFSNFTDSFSSLDSLPK
jgi:hypothetical protein